MKKILILVLVIVFTLGLLVPGYALFLQTQQDAASMQVSQAKESNPMWAFKLKYADANAVSSALKDLLAEGEKVSVNSKLNTIIFRASEHNLKRVAKVIEEMDQPPLQVMVEAKIIELKSGNGDTTNPSELAASWKYERNSNDSVQFYSTDTVATSLAASALGLYGTVLSGNVTAYLQALEKKIGYDLIASPWITALNHEEAEILIGSKYGYQTSIVSQTSTTQKIEYLEVGTKLKFTPHINDDGFIIMELAPSVSEGSVTNSLPQENTTETKNKVLVKDGQTIIVGGLTKNYNTQTEFGVPLLMHIPWLGSLFRNTQLQSEKRDIMIVITPHIVTPAVLDAMQEKVEAFEARQAKKASEAGLIH